MSSQCNLRSAIWTNAKTDWIESQISWPCHWIGWWHHDVQTTLSRAVYKALGGESNCVYLTHDHYYRDQSHKTMEERAKTNFDHPDSLETELLIQHLRDLKEGKIAVLPTYDFTTHARTPVTTMVRIGYDNEWRNNCQVTIDLISTKILASRKLFSCRFIREKSLLLRAFWFLQTQIFAKNSTWKYLW